MEYRDNVCGARCVWMGMQVKQLIGASAALLTMAAAGCQGNGAQDPDGDAGQGNGGVAATEHPPPGEDADSTDGTDGTDGGEGAGDDVAAGQIDGSALPEDYPEEVSTGDEGTTLVITAVESSGCVTASADIAGQSEREVTVTLVHTEENGDVMCTQQITYPPVEVELDEQLGDRTVVLETEDRQR